MEEIFERLTLHLLQQNHTILSHKPKKKIHIHQDSLFCADESIEIIFVSYFVDFCMNF